MLSRSAALPRPARFSNPRLVCASLRPYVTSKKAGKSSSKSSPSTASSSSSEPASPSQREPTWLTKKLKQSPLAMNMFLGLAGWIGFATPKQVAARRASYLYSKLCATRADEDIKFWQQECDLPPTFQSWFTITNLHVWLLTVRLRALPHPHGLHHIQALIDHFFLDVEDRMRAVLQPASYAVSKREPPRTDFYPTLLDSPEAPEQTEKREKRGNAPETLITRQMKIFRDQWAGMGLAMDLGLVKGDAEMAGAIWRNLLGARGARGIDYSQQSPSFRRSVNPTDSRLASIKDEEALVAAEAQDDNSGVHDYFAEEVNKYLGYPELMETLIEYMRRELVRLEKVRDREIMGSSEPNMAHEGVEELKFGSVRR